MNMEKKEAIKTTPGFVSWTWTTLHKSYDLIFENLHFATTNFESKKSIIALILTSLDIKS